ncbi:hypothetical protein EYC84_004417 [Monilinia fructicola]|uniref:F-box domain-containing protein n=1 Tax=Monilinia fructicola TaxID=38448 RepID=A0A5M9K0A9_MONFR|nr:hypothetical protein EYC84_004417 [Monilinia fructicola]
MPLPKAQKLSNEGLRKEASTARSCKRSAPKDHDKNGDIIGSETSIASRKRRCPRVTMASLQIDDENDDLNQFTTSFGADSHSHNTWGLAVSTTIVATKRKRKTATFNLSPGFGLKHATHSACLSNGLPSPCSLETTPEVIEMNCPARSPLLRYPLEVRERIYGYFLRSPKSIIMNYDWKAVKRCPNFTIKKILFICKQITAEALSFLYKNNTFYALLRESKSLPDWCISKVPSTYLSLIRNVILECPKDNWDLDWYYKAARSIGTLTLAKPVLDTLAIVMTPQQVQFSSTALGLEAAPITFADFLWKDGAVIAAIMKLGCKNLKVVMNKNDGRRIMLEIAVNRIFTTPDDQDDWFKNDRPYQQGREDLKKKGQDRIGCIERQI